MDGLTWSTRDLFWVPLVCMTFEVDSEKRIDPDRPKEAGGNEILYDVIV